MSGFVLLHRDLIGNPQFRGKDDEYAAIWLISMASWEPSTVRVCRESVDLGRGQLAHAISYMAQAWECSKATAHGRLRHFEKIGFIRTDARTHYTLITVCKYSEYQDSPNAARTQARTRPERCPNAARTNIKEGKEVKEGKEGSTPLTPAASEPDFETWWAAYPSGRKTAKPKCLEKYRRIVKSGEATAEQLLDGALRYAAAGYAGSKFVKGPEVWLNKGCWADEDIPPPGDLPTDPPPRPTYTHPKSSKAAFDKLDAELAGRSYPQ